MKGIGFCLRTAYADRQIVHKRYDVRDIRDAVGFHIGAYVIAAADVPQVFSTVDRPPIRVKLGCENKAGALGERIGSFVPVVLMDRPVGWKPVASNLFDAAGQTEEAA